MESQPLTHTVDTYQATQYSDITVTVIYVTAYHSTVHVPTCIVSHGKLTKYINFLNNFSPEDSQLT